MKVKFALGVLAIAASMSACDMQHAQDPIRPLDEGGGGKSAGDAVGTVGDRAGTSASSADGEAGAVGDDDTGAGGSTSHGAGAAGGSTSHGGRATGGSSDHGAGTGGGSTNHGDGAAGRVSDTPETAGGAAGDDDGDEDAGAEDTGSAGDADGIGSAGISGTGGSGGLASTAGASGTSAGGGAGGLPASGGSGATAGSDDGGGALDPELLFTKETFGGNGRTCVTCHTAATGTISASEVEVRYAVDPSEPLFRRIDSDDGASDDYTELRQRATFRVTIPLPPGVTLTSDPTATSIVLRRSLPTTINTPALDPVLMWDGRASDLMAQAKSAILGHAEATVIPTDAQLALIAEFEQGPAFFSSDLLREYDQGGPAPTWPAGVTDEEQRGRRWFAEDSAAPRFNICGQCHGGPMTNETQANSGLPVGKRFQTANVSEFNTRDNPTYSFEFPDPKNPGQTVTVVTPDPGRALITGDVRDLNFFKIPTLWGVKSTAPYFHDGSASTLEELMEHYEKHLATFLRRNASYPTPHVPTDQDKLDIIAYLKLL